MSAQIRKKNDRSKLVDQDYSRRMYAMADEGYLTNMRQVTQKYLDSVMLVKQSAWKKPYRESEYGTMEYKGDRGVPPVPVVGVGTSDCTPKGDLVGGGKSLCSEEIDCGTWVWNCAHRIIKFETLDDFGWIQSIQYLPGDIVKVTVCWNESDRDAGRMIGPKAIMANGKSFISSFDFGTCCPTTKACKGKCDGCAAPTIGYTSLQMTIGGVQALTHSGGGAGGKYTWSTDYGTFNEPTGPGVLYTAPSSNAECANNPTITLTDCCGHSATLKLAVNGYGTNIAGYYASELFTSDYTPLCCLRSGGTCSWQVTKKNFRCDGVLGTTYSACSSGHNGRSCTTDQYDAWCETECNVERAACIMAICTDGCAAGLHDTRSAAYKTAGCCPYQLIV